MCKEIKIKKKKKIVLFPTWIFCFLFFLSVTNKQTAARESIQICQVAMTIVKLILIKCPCWVGRATYSNRGPQVLSGGWQESQYFPSNSLKRSLNCCYLECWDSKRGKPYIKAHSQRSPLRKTAHSPGIVWSSVLKDGKSYEKGLDENYREECYEIKRNPEIKCKTFLAQDYSSSFPYTTLAIHLSTSHNTIKCNVIFRVICCDIAFMIIIFPTLNYHKDKSYCNASRWFTLVFFVQ